MKIGQQKSVLDPQLGGVSTVEPGAHGAERPAEGTSDTVRVSDVARALARLMAQPPAADPTREAQLTALRGAIERGQYQPDLHGVARRLLTEVFGPLTAV